MRLMVLLVLLVVAPDLANPLVPGAFTFDPTGSIDISRSDEHAWDEPAAAHESEALTPPVAPTLRPRPRLPALLVSVPARVAPRGAHMVPVPESHRLASDTDH